ncbi:uncharacterized protein LOC126905245 [Daktulosphaira vitifoliae]|uniref:uncharacterized protein LOC126905245 n=1 Tax=Daktulosphaira vitifoliae TaxID=58002 RepID=UPI0021AA67CE|nr:uncharacterized protein LOC126905245 [Daktulosphaira vitifoliae]
MEKNSVSSISENEPNNQELSGRRIVNISHLIQQIQKRHGGPYDCSFVDMEYESEVIYGFSSVITFKCKVCNIKTKLHTEDMKQSEMRINKAVVNACHAIGIGHTQLQEFAGFLDLPVLCSRGFLNIQTEVAEVVHATAWDEMKKAGDEERKLAFESGDVDIDGTPVITVVTDGQWSKRSYKTKYDALSGAATIIGLKTQKVLFVGIRNKYCIICQRASSMKIKNVPDHKCFLNWKKASTCMEADCILEGFSKSIEMHGLKYNCLIGDGDSSVTKRLVESRPYGIEFNIKKIECKNHLLRNYTSKLTAMARNTKYPLRVRKFILSNILRFRSDVQKAALHWRKEAGLTKLQKIKGLKNDLINAPYHRLGQHTKCSSYFCTGSKETTINLVPEAETGEMMREILNISSRLVSHSESLLENKTSNICEQFNSLINKHVGGKRLNFCGRGNYNTRVEAAVVAFNSKEYLRQIHKKTSNCSPGKFGKKFLLNHERIKCNTSRRRQLFPDKRKCKKPKSNGADEDYGLAEPLIEIFSPEEIEMKKNNFLESLGQADVKKIEIETRDQSNNAMWYSERKKRLTASNYGQICKMRSNTSCRNVVYNILYAPDVQSKALQHGKIMEAKARQEVERLLNKIVNNSGLVVDPDFPYLAASPDGVIEENYLVEIKCPYSARDSSSAVEAVENKLLQYCKFESAKLKLKENHVYFYQIMGQLHSTRREKCFFVIYTNKWINIEEIYYNQTFWNEKMSNQLRMFYMECLLPEIVDPQFPKRLLKSDIKEPKKISKNTRKN